MRLTEKLQSEGCLESDSMKWVIAGIAFRSQIRPIIAKKQPNGKENKGCEEDSDEEYCTTPTGRGTRIPEKMKCPGAPRKRRATPSATCNLVGGGREFFNPPDLESVFVRHSKRGN